MGRIVPRQSGGASEAHPHATSIGRQDARPRPERISVPLVRRRQVARLALRHQNAARLGRPQRQVEPDLKFPSPPHVPRGRTEPAPLPPGLLARQPLARVVLRAPRRVLLRVGRHGPRL